MAVVKKVKKVGAGKKSQKKSRRVKVEVTLPTEKSVPSEFLQDFSILIYGNKKIGKTSLLSMFPNTFFMFCEPGGKGLSVYARPVRNWLEFKAYVDLIVKDKRFKTVVVDTVDYAYDYCMDYICEKLVIDHPSDLDWGKGWKAVKKEFISVISKLEHAGKGIVYISHAREEEIQKKGGNKFHRTSNTMPGQAKEVMESLTDIWVYYTYDGEKRVIVLKGDDFIDAGHRDLGETDRFLYKDGSRIRKIPMGDSKEEAYENFMKAFNNQLEKPKLSGKKKKKLKLRKR